jgi:uncharacterized RDD family membrane protein YckC
MHFHAEKGMRWSRQVTTVADMSDDNPTPPPSEGAVPPPPPPPPPSYGAPPPQQPPAGGQPGYGAPPAYGAPPPAYGMPPAGMPPALPYAQWPQRVLASLIDSAPVIVVYIIAAISGSGALLALFYLVALGWSIYNAGVQQGTTGYSLGKGIVGIKLISEETGQPVGTGLAIGRIFVHILDGFCLIGYLWPLWDAKRQTFADKSLNTVVITAPKA